jgi:phage baseplate assembly protein W
MTTIFDTPLVGYRFVNTIIGDSLQRIAQRALGDATQWPLLIAYNNLIPPYITDDPAQAGPQVIQTGEQILVPASAPVVESAVDPDQVFLIDIALTNGLITSGANADLALVAGLDNLQQALANRVISTSGILLFHSEYGSFIKRLLGTANGPTVELLAAQYAAAAIIADDRVSEIIQATASITGVEVDVSVDVQPVVGQPLTVTATLPLP